MEFALGVTGGGRFTRLRGGCGDRYAGAGVRGEIRVSIGAGV